MADCQNHRSACISSTASASTQGACPLSRRRRAGPLGLDQQLHQVLDVRLALFANYSYHGFITDRD